MCVVCACLLSPPTKTHTQKQQVKLRSRKELYQSALQQQQHHLHHQHQHRQQTSSIIIITIIIIRRPYLRSIHQASGPRDRMFGHCASTTATYSWWRGLLYYYCYYYCLWEWEWEWEQEWEWERDCYC